MKRFSVIIGLLFFVGVLVNGCDKGDQPPEPGVKDAAKTEMEEPAQEVIDETAQDVNEAVETVKKEAGDAADEAKEKAEETVETSKKEAEDTKKGAEEEAKGLLNQ